MLDILNEHDADQEVIQSLLRHISQKDKDHMQDVILYKDQDGNIKRAHNFENINRDDITDRINELSAELQEWQNALTTFDNLNGSDTPAAPEAPAAPVDAAPTDPNVLGMSAGAELQPVELSVTPAAEVAAPVDSSVQSEPPAPQVISDVQPLQ